MVRNSTTWTSSWQSGKTKIIRIPEALEHEIMAYARARDVGKCLLQGNCRDEILIAIKKYTELRSADRHPNQHSQGKDLDTNARTWDELRRFVKMVETAPEKLGLTNPQL